MDYKHEIINDSIKYAGSRYITIPLAIAASIIRKRFLGPTQVGIWQALSILKAFSSFSEAGILRGAARELPYFIGQKNQEHFELTKNTTFSSTLLASFGVNFIIFFASFFIEGLSHLALIGIRIIALVSLLQALLSFFTVVYLRAMKNFTLLSKQIVLAEIINICLTTILAYYFKIYGVYVSAIVMVSVSIVFIYFNTNCQLKLSIEKKELLRLFKIGFPILLYAIVLKTFLHIDRLMVLKMINVTALGFYSIATMVATVISDLPLSLAVVIFPRLQEAFGQKGNINDIKNFVLSPTLILAYLMPFFISLCYVVIPLLVKYFLPQFYDGINAMKILILGSFFLALVYCPNLILITLSKQWKALLIVSNGLIIGFFLNLLFIRIGWGINGVAFATTITYFIYGVFLTSYSLSHFSQKKEILLFLIKIYLPFIYMLLFLWCLDNIIVLHTDINLQKDVLLGIIKIISLILFNLPLLYYVNKKTEVIKILFGHCINFLSRFKARQ